MTKFLLRMYDKHLLLENLDLALILELRKTKPLGMRVLKSLHLMIQMFVTLVASILLESSRWLLFTMSFTLLLSFYFVALFVPTSIRWLRASCSRSGRPRVGRQNIAPP